MIDRVSPSSSASTDGTGRTGFTLVELLVVIGIISVLIAVLLPALNKARESAKTISCLSNLRTFGQATANYLAENQGQLFPCRYGSFGTDANNPVAPTTTGLADILARYIPKSSVTSGPPKPTMWTCPNAYSDNVNQYPMTYACNQGVHVNYGYAAVTVAAPIRQPVAWTDATGRTYGTLKRVSKLRRTTEIVTIADTSQSSGAWTTAGYIDFTTTNFAILNSTSSSEKSINASGLWNNNNTDTGNYHPRYRHGNNRLINVLFLDGHAETFPFVNATISPNGGLKYRNFATAY